MGRNGAVGAAVRRRRIHEHIRLLCRCGAGLEAIASPLCAAVRDLIGADSGSLFWLDEMGVPAGFFHDCAPAEIKDLFITRFEDLFLGPEEINVIELTRSVEPSIGRLLDPAFEQRFWRSNIYQYLCVPLGHRHMLDVRIEVNGVGQALFCAWNRVGRPFTQADADALRPAQIEMQHAVAVRRADVHWRSLDSGSAHFITDVAGLKLIAIDEEAEAMLMKSHLLQQNVSMTRQPRGAPGFAAVLAKLLSTQTAATLHLPVANGRIVARATRTRSIAPRGTSAQEMMFVALGLQIAADVLVVEYLMSLPLFPLQREIALFAMQGRSRSDCRPTFSVGDEALKKHLRAIFDATGARKWTDLVDLDPTVQLEDKTTRRSGDGLSAIATATGV